jgi:predicted signal transduction protein with EAL and GGDEF domain
VGIRDASTAGFHGTSIIARLGGDEFAILVNSIRSQADAVLVAECILRQLSSPFQLNGRQMFATVSIGIAMSSDGHSPEDLLRNADTAMYQAKTRGKARLEVFDETMRDRALARLEVETDLRKAISGGQLALFYQPKICLRTHRVAGYEALVRWNHPERGIVGPDEFIRIAEETGLIVPLGRWVLREACRQMAEWHHRFKFNPQPTVSVNVSFKQFTEGDIVEDVRQALAETGLNPRSLTLEMTESTLMSNPDTATRTLLQLRELNVGLEIDDFGTGYSSLSYLNRLPFDTLKIDRSFIKDLTSGGDGSDIVKTILELARSMNMDVVAEGVETEDQLRILEALGSNYAQSFYFSKPVSADVTQALLQERYQLRQAFAALQSANVSASPVDSCDQEEPVRSRCIDCNSDEGLRVQTWLREEEPQSA